MTLHQRREMGHLSWLHCSFLIKQYLFCVSLKSLPLYGSLAICGQHLAISLLPFLKYKRVRYLIFFFMPHITFVPHLQAFYLGMCLSLSVWYLVQWSIILVNCSSFEDPYPFSLNTRWDDFLSLTRCIRSLTYPQFATWQFSAYKLIRWGV